MRVLVTGGAGFVGSAAFLFSFSGSVRGHQLWPWHVAVSHVALHDAGRGTAYWQVRRSGV